MYKRLSELLAAARLISRASGAKIKELEEHLGISRRSVYRLLDTLEDLGYPLYDDFDGKERVIHLNEERDNLRWWLPFPKVQFSREDAVLLEYLFKDASRIPAVAGELARLKQKLAPLLSEGGYVLNDRIDVFSAGGGGPSIRETGPIHPTILKAPELTKGYKDATGRLIKTILQGIQEQSVCIVSYQAISTGTTKTYRIHPLTLIEKNGNLYLFVFVPYYGHIRILAVERIKKIEITEEDFETPTNFNPTPWINDPFGIILGEPFTARIRFSEEQAPYIQELRWPEGSGLEQQEDGTLILTVHTAGAYELKRWVLSFGPSAQILEPDFLRMEILEDLRETLEHYSTDKNVT